MIVPENSEPLVVVVAGPTGSGKSALAVRLAQRFHGDIVNYDSMQVYRGFDVGTAKTTIVEHVKLEAAGIRHHLLDVADPEENFTAGDFARLAEIAIREIAAAGRLPILVGGTGFYLRALLEGLFDGPARDEALRARLSQREVARPGSLHRLLRRLDPEAGARIHANDSQKTMRALEVRLLTGRPMAEAFAQATPGLTGYRVVKLGLNPDREALYGRLNQRARAMFDEGLLEETKALLSRYDAASKPFASLGYVQAVRCLRQELSREEAIVETQLKTRQYAKRQWTWFRADDEIHWLNGFGEEADVQEKAGLLVAAANAI